MKNTIIETATKNIGILSDLVETVSVDSAEYKLLMWAFHNEGGILCVTKQLCKTVENIQRRLNEVQQRLEEGCPQLLNTYILQGYSGELNRAVSKLAYLDNNRNRYAEYLVETPQNKKTKRIKELEDENAKLKEVLRSLVDVQNGAPLIEYEKDWQKAMDEAQQLLKEESNK